MEGYLVGALVRAVGEDDESHIEILGSYSHGSYQGEARYAIANRDRTKFAEGSISWGSCSFCDPWDGMSEEEIEGDLDRSVVAYDSQEQFITYISGVARLGETLSWYDDDATFARNVLLRFAQEA